MKTIATLLILALASTTLAADSTCTYDNKCIACTGTDCTSVYQGFLSADKKFTAFTDSNCVAGSAADTCTQCKKTHAWVETASSSGTTKANTCLELGSATGTNTSCTAYKVASFGTGDDAEKAATVECVLCGDNKSGTNCGTDGTDSKCSIVIASTAKCSSCSSGNVLVGTACEAQGTKTTGCLSTSANTSCDIACDYANSYYASAAGVCTKSSSSSGSSFAKIAGVFVTIALFFANF